MKKAIVVVITLFVGVAGARADYYETTYRDLIRPHGKPRSDAIYQANLDTCYGQTHEDRTRPDTPAFKRCMLARGYRFLAVRDVKTTPPRANSVSQGLCARDYRNRSDDRDGQDVDTSADDAAALAASQAATEATNAGIAATVAGIAANNP